jgi:hypothetical protein
MNVIARLTMGLQGESFTGLMRPLCEIRHLTKLATHVLILVATLSIHIDLKPACDETR